MADKYIEQKLEEHGEELRGIRSELKDMNTTLVRNTEQLAEHMRRTAQNEAAIREAQEAQRKLEEEASAKREADKKVIDERMKPIERHVALVNFTLKLGIWLCGLPACAYYVIRIFREFIIK